MRIIHSSAADQTKFRDTQTALVRARHRPDVRATAEKWLGHAVASAELAQARERTANLAWTGAVSVTAVALSALFDAVCFTREFYFTAGGRRRDDPMGKVLFTKGVSELRKLPPSLMLEEVWQLADRIDTTAHPKVTRERAKEEADKLRALYSELAPKVQALTVATLAKAAAETAFANAANVCRLELASFKRALQAEKMREAAIHEIIPGYSTSRRAKKQAPTLPSGGTASPSEAPVGTPPTPSETPTPTA
jgi:hypothetical protein